MTETILLCGVGGQGTILAAHILADVALSNGMDVKVSEIHGMSQRGGAVTTVVRFGEDVESMICGKGEADTVVSFELLESLRNFSQLKDGGLMVSSDEIIKPASVLTGKAPLPDNIRGKLMDAGAMIVPAAATAAEIGNSKVSNIVLLGALSYSYSFPQDSWIDSVCRHVPAKFKDLNIEAFKAGYAFAKEHRS